MGFFKSFTKVFARAATAVVTGGGSEVLRAVSRPAATQLQSLLNPTTLPQLIRTASVVAAPFTGGKSLAFSGLASGFLPQRDAQYFQPSDPTQHSGSGGPMALNIGGLLSGVQGIFGGGSNPYFQNVSNIAGLASNFFQSSRSVPGLPGPSALPIATGGSALMLRGGGMVPRGGMVARGFFNRYPNLGLALQQLRDRGMTVKRSQLYSMLKRFGPEVLITGGLLTAAAVNELMVAGAGRRRMNPANVHALRRSIRRVDSFHKLCVMTDRLRRPRRSSAGKAGSKSQQFVRQG